MAVPRIAATDARGWQRGDALIAAGALAACLCSQLSADNIETGPVICPFRISTGLPCPGCGMTRAWTYTLHGQLGNAASANVFGMALLAVVITLTLWRLASIVPRVARTIGGPPLAAFLDRGTLVVLVATPWLVWGFGRAIYYGITGTTY